MIKKNKLKENIKKLEDLSINFQESINNIKDTYEKINENKEKLKLKIQKIFTKIRNELNNREDELLLEADKHFDKLFLNEEIVKNSEKFPNKIKLSIEKGKIIEKEINNDNNKISIFVNDCLNIENNIKDIMNIKDSIEKCKNSFNSKITFYPEEDKDEINKFIDNIKTFGKIRDFIYLDSSIINNDIKYQNLIMNRIDKKINKESIKFELIFRMSENGSNSKDFHKFCDDKGPTLTLVKTSKNYIFGGFTPLNWKTSGGEIYDNSNQTFLFSLNLMKKYDLINYKKNYAIYNAYSTGPNFGASDFSLNSNMKEGITYANSVCSFFSNNNLEIIGEKGSNQKFLTEELELFKVIY